MPTLHRPGRPADAIEELTFHRRVNVDDSFEIAGDLAPPFALFGHVPGTKGAAAAHRRTGLLFERNVARIDHWYARTDVDMNRAAWPPGVQKDAARALFQIYAAHTLVTLILGDIPQWQAALAELLRDRAWEPPSVVAARGEADLAAAKERQEVRVREGVDPLTVPIRAHVSVKVEPDVDATLIDELRRAMDGFTITAWVHLEGWEERFVY